MSSWKVDTASIKSVCSNFDNLSNGLIEIRHSVQALSTIPGISFSGWGKYAKKLIVLSEEITQESNSVKKLGSNLLEVAAVYEKTERNILERGNKDGSGKVKSIAVWYEDYVNKGNTYKTIQTTKAIGSILATVGAAAAMMTSGVGVSLMMLSGAYMFNSVISSGWDIYNCWWGNVDEVGNINVLKSATVDGWGDIGALFGSKELGENIGKGVYATGALLSVATEFEIFAGEVIQAPDMMNGLKNGISELGTGIKGIRSIVTTTPMKLKYDLKLLAYEVPNLVNVCECVSILYDIGKKTKDTVETVIDTFV